MRENQTWSIEQVESLEEVDDIEATSAKAEIPKTNFYPWGTPRWKKQTTKDDLSTEKGQTTTTEPNGVGHTQTGDAASKKKD